MQVIDSHTEGEPTRLVVSGGPPLGNGSMAQRLEIFARDYDHYRAFAANEPRGYDAVVGALLCEPVDSACAAGLIFFNNTGYLGMCGHGTIGAAVTLANMGRIGLGRHQFETPVGRVNVHLSTPNQVTIENVASYRFTANVQLDIDGWGAITGDVAWGGNWFFLCHGTPCELISDNIPLLSHYANSVKRELEKKGIQGANSAPIDHIEFFGPAHNAGANSRNFVMCPGGAYDRSPCGTGTSAKLACLAANGTLQPGQVWVQESIIGSQFEAQYQLHQADLSTHNFVAPLTILPSITGRAYVTARCELIAQLTDPLVPKAMHARS